MPGAPPALSAASAVSGHLDTRTAAQEVADRLAEDLGPGGCDLLTVFASFHHRAALPEAMETLRRQLEPRTSLATTTESIVSTERDYEGLAGLGACALRLPDVTIAPWMGTPDDPLPISDPHRLAERISLRHDTRGAILLGDPFSTPATRLLPAMDAAAGDDGLLLFGGMASGSNRAGENVLVVDDRVLDAGVIGVTLGGPLQLDAVVSQGCRPIGEPMVVTRIDQHVILELGGRPAFEVMDEIGASLDEHERELLRTGLFIGHVIDESRRPFGRGDFLVRSVLGLDRKRKGLVVADAARLGQTVQMHVRDARTAAEDLQLLLDGQQLHEPPAAGLLFTCNGRGRRLFGTDLHDAGVIRARLGDLPLAGFMAAGEIGPVGRRSFLHGHTAVLCLVRPPA